MNAGETFEKAIDDLRAKIQVMSEAIDAISSRLAEVQQHPALSVPGIEGDAHVRDQGETVREAEK